MASITNNNISNYDYLLRNCYSSNRMARKTYNRVSMKTADLAAADSAALKKIAANLKDLDYKNTDNGVSIYNNVKALVETYNNLDDSASEDPSLNKNLKRLKNLVKDHQDELEEIGIKIKSSGKLEIDKTTLVSCSSSKVGRVLSGDNDLTKSIMDYSKRILRSTKALISSKNTAMENPTTTTTASDASTTTTNSQDTALTSLLNATSVMNSTSIDYRA